MQPRIGPARRQRIIVAEPAALADRTAGVPQVVLQKVAVGIVVHQILVDVGDILRTQQVAHLLVIARPRMAENQPVTQCQPGVERSRKQGAEVQVAEPLGAVFEGIDGMARRHAVLGDQFVPVDLRIARVAGPPRLLGLAVTGITGQVTVVVGHRRACVVPSQRTVFARAVLRAEIGGKRRRLRNRHPVGEDSQRHEFPPHARIADLAVLESPCGVIEPVARKPERLFGRGETRTPDRGRNDERQAQVVIVAEPLRGAQTRSQRIGEDAFDVHVSPRTGVEGRRAAPIAAERFGDGQPRPGQIITVRKADGGIARRLRVIVGKTEQTQAAGTARRAVCRGKTAIADFIGPQQAHRPEIARRKPHAPDRSGFIAVIQSPAFHGDVRQVKGGMFGIEVGSRLHGTVKQRRVGQQKRRTLLLPGGVGIIFVIGMLGRGTADGEQTEQQTTVFRDHAQRLFGIQI